MVITEWQGCYDDGWQGDIVPEAFTHPAKFSRGLIHRIYKHAKEMGWVKSGDTVLDCFGGVGLGGLDAMSMGLNWIGVELESKFVDLGNQNIDKWYADLRGWPNLGTARMVQGDSRNLRAVLEGADIVVSSPPFTETHGRQKKIRGNWCNRGGDGFLHNQDYANTPGNLANMKEGDIDCVISSPPFSGDSQGVPVGTNQGKIKRAEQKEAGKGAALDGYGHTPGQLGSMKEGSIDLIASSPPYEGILERDRSKEGYAQKEEKQKYFKSQGSNNQSKGYNPDSDNLGNTSGDTFWSASKEIISQCYDLLKPNGMSIWVCKDYVKSKKRVPFSDRWQTLCESVGFILVCRHQAMLVKEHGTQMTSYGDEKITTERKSFFRRLAESKGSPKIDFEDVICMTKIGG